MVDDLWAMCVGNYTSLQDGKRVIGLAKDKGHLKVVQLLVQSGAQVCTH